MILAERIQVNTSLCCFWGSHPAKKPMIFLSLGNPQDFFQLKLGIFSESNCTTSTAERPDGKWSFPPTRSWAVSLGPSGWVEVRVLFFGRKNQRNLCPGRLTAGTYSHHPWKERKMIWNKPLWLCSMLIFQGVCHRQIWKIEKPTISVWQRFANICKNLISCMTSQGFGSMPMRW